VDFLLPGFLGLFAIFLKLGDLDFHLFDHGGCDDVGYYLIFFIFLFVLLYFDFHLFDFILFGDELFMIFPKYTLVFYQFF
jgi:hypothetical protein